MTKQFTSLGFMSGTSGDGVDASMIRSNGVDQYEVIKEAFFEYDLETFKEIHSLKDKIILKDDLKKFKREIIDLEKKITLFHAKIFKELCYENKIDIIGFHGQTIYHNPSEKISKQLGDGHLLSQLTKSDIVCNFRDNDLKNGGEGAPLTPIFHQLIVSHQKFKFPVGVLNIGGISNITIINAPTGINDFISRDIGPGNCLIDTWIRKNSNDKFDKDGLYASSGRINEIIIEQAQELFSNKFKENTQSFDVSDFDVSFARGLSLEDGSATITEFTANIISSSIITYSNKNKPLKVLLCGGGRKNKFLIERIKKKISKNLILEEIDNYGINGDFVESQAFGFLAIRSILNLPNSFPKTTKCISETIGGEIIRY